MNLVLTCKQTCDACPSQWEGMLEDGRMFYIRYRWGELTVSISPAPTKNVYDAVRGVMVMEEQLGGEWDGVLDTVRMMHHTRPIFDWTQTKFSR